jgi:threonine/homoserine/homoserine lactone efflux protein
MAHKMITKESRFWRRFKIVFYILAVVGVILYALIQDRVGRLLEILGMLWLCWIAFLFLCEQLVEAIKRALREHRTEQPFGADWHSPLQRALTSAELLRNRAARGIKN